MITVICPTYNEEAYIGDVIKFFINAPPIDKELLVIDGGSEDETTNIVKEFCNENNRIRLILNESKYVPFALNLGLKLSSGDPIIRLDAHTRYEHNYFEKIIETFKSSKADIVGGAMNAVGISNFQKSVAFTTSTKFGVGDSKIHQRSYRGESDHVYLGAWRRKLFDEIGYFDERLKRNQDDEFHYRARSLGKRIHLNPEIKSYYYPRDSFIKLINQYFQYGLFKPIVLKKIRSEAKIRHLIPSLFTIYILLVPLVFISVFYLVPLFVYLFFDLYFSLQAKTNVKVVVLSMFVYPIRHLSYGFGFLKGLLKLSTEK